MKTLEYVNPEMRKTLDFPFQMGGLSNPRKHVKSSPFLKEVISESIAVVNYSVNLTWSGAGFLM